MMQFIWRLPSSDGWNGMTVKVGQVVHQGGAPLFLAKIMLRGSFWNRSCAVSEINDRSAVVLDFRIVLPEVVIDRDLLSQAHSMLMDWVGSRRLGSCLLTSNTNQVFRIELGQGKDMIFSLEKPIFIVGYAVSRLRFEVQFPVDESCICIATSGIEECLRLI